MFDSDAYVTPSAQGIAELFRSVWASLAHPGATWNGEERVAIAAIGRAAREKSELSPMSLQDSGLSPPAVQAAAVLGGDSGRIRAPWVNALYEAGITPEGYVEIVSIVSRVTVVDSFHRALGLALIELPGPETGDPTGEVDARARRSSRAYGPTVGPPMIPTALSAIPAEMAAMADIQDTMYMTGEDMEEPDFRRDGLHRTQIELVASRTSQINECFY